VGVAQVVQPDPPPDDLAVAVPGGGLDAGRRVVLQPVGEVVGEGEAAGVGLVGLGLDLNQVGGRLGADLLGLLCGGALGNEEGLGAAPALAGDRVGAPISADAEGEAAGARSFLHDRHFHYPQASPPAIVRIP
jgi:hypothetical protein